MKMSCVLMLISFFIISCNKKVSTSTAPKLTFSNVSTNYFPAGNGNVNLGLYFYVNDIEGDIGFNESNIYLVDSRYPTDTQKYVTPNIPAGNNTNKAFVELLLDGGFILLRNDSIHVKNDTLFYTLSMKDKAGNQSNFINTPSIFLYN